MISKLVAGLAGTVLLGTTMAAALPVAADASTTQKICSSKYSTSDVIIFVKSSGDYFSLDATECKTVRKGGTTIYLFGDYKVGYGGDYSTCRHTNGFTPYTKASRVYFRTYPNINC